MAIKYVYGSYVGDGNDNRDIGGLYISSFAAMFITRGDVVVFRHAGMGANGVDIGCYMVGSTVRSNFIQSITPGIRFQIGNDSNVNNNGTSFYWIAFAQDPLIQYGSYVGDGQVGRNILTPGMTPSLVIVCGKDGGAGGGDGNGMYPSCWRSTPMAGDFTLNFSGSGGQALNEITAMGAGGFTVGNFWVVNETNHDYYWIAFGTDSSKLAVGTYVGNNADNRNIVLAPAIAPVFGFLRRVSVANNRLHNMRWFVPSGDLTAVFSSGYTGDCIQELRADGFQVGADMNVNGNDAGGDGVNTYYYAMLTAALADPDPTAGYSKALPDACGHSLMVNPLPQL